jgi:hypothetical protein
MFMYFQGLGIQILFETHNFHPIIMFFPVDVWPPWIGGKGRREMLNRGRKQGPPGHRVGPTWGAWFFFWAKWSH